MSLVNQTAWVVGGVGVVGRGITRGLLQAGATVIVNSRSPERLDTLKEGLGRPERLITIHGSLLPGYASKTVADTLADSPPLNHVVAHGAVRWWARQTPGTYEYYEYRAGCDETYSLNIKANQKLLDMSPEEFAQSSAQLASLHFSAAQNLIPRLDVSAKATGAPSTYTFVTGDGSGKPGGDRTAMGEINSHHVWGLSAALRREYEPSTSVAVREVRVGLPINPAAAEKDRTSTVSEAVGDLCAGLAAGGLVDNGQLIKLDQFEDLDKMLAAYNVAADSRVGDLPHHLCDQGELSGSL